MAVNPVCGITFALGGGVMTAPDWGIWGAAIGAGASLNKKSPGLMKLSKLKSNLKLLKLNLSCCSVGSAILKGLGWPIFLDIS